MFRDDLAALKPADKELILVKKDDNKMKARAQCFSVTVFSRVLQEFQSFKYMSFASPMTVTAVDWHPKKKGQSAAPRRPLGHMLQVSLAWRTPASTRLTSVLTARPRSRSPSSSSGPLPTR